MDKKAGKEPTGKITKTELVDEIMNIFKRENLTAKSAWNVLSAVREHIHENAYKNTII